jgi:hypothetical protein
MCTDCHPKDELHKIDAAFEAMVSLQANLMDDNKEEERRSS